MIEFLQSSLAKDLLICLFMLWPALVILRRLGLPFYYAIVIFGSIFLPFAGYALFALLIVLSNWPKFPALPTPKRRTA